MKAHHILIYLVIGLVLFSCKLPLHSFKNTPQPLPPDYSLEKHWAALPNKKDSADFQLKQYGVVENQKNAKADVFFVPPSNYLSGQRWNVSVEDSLCNKITDTTGCRLEASVFNESCRVYVPRCRSAIIYTYFARKKNSDKAMALAYEDVKNAFVYYLKNYNKGRPIIIASHSQGTDYAIKLVKEFFDQDTSLKKQFVTAYLIGRPIYDTTFKKIKPSYSATEVGGYVTWNSVSYKTNTFYGKPVGKIIGVNPLSWTGDTVYVPASFNKGGLTVHADKIDVTVADAKLAPSGFLWVQKPSRSTEEYPGINTPYYHKNDYLFYYMNIRENVRQRIEQFFKEKKDR